MDHEKCRSSVCIICHKKGKRALTDRQIEYIQKNIVRTFTMDNSSFPCATRIKCNNKLNSNISGQEVDLPVAESHDAQQSTMLRWRECNCRICQIAKDSINSKIKGRKPGRPKQSVTTPEAISEETPQETPEAIPEETPQETPEAIPEETPQETPEAIPEETPQETPEAIPEETPKSSSDAGRIVLCENCLSKIGKGYPHHCTRRDKVSNVERLLSTTPTTAARYVSRVKSSLDEETPNISALGRPKKETDDASKAKKLLLATDLPLR